jgi:hypothetical protein
MKQITGQPRFTAEKSRSTALSPFLEIGLIMKNPWVIQYLI